MSSKNRMKLNSTAVFSFSMHEYLQYKSQLLYLCSPEKLVL